VAAVHRVLIAAAFACALFYGVWELRGFAATGERGAMLRGVLALIVSGGIGLYLRSLRGLAAKLTPRD
jgi:hypothetical protein